MREKFCPKCGRSVEKLYNGLCKDCFLEKFSLVKDIPDRIIVKICKSCGKYFIDQKESHTLENTIDLFLPDLLENPEITNATYRIEKNKIHLNLDLKFDDLEKKEEKTSELVIKSILCQSCSMKKSGYFQAILQVRAPKQLHERLEQEVKNQINFLAKHNKSAFISKIENTKNGFDVYIGSRSVANEVAKKLKNKFIAEKKISRKLSGMKGGKRVYRGTILVSIGD